MKNLLMLIVVCALRIECFTIEHSIPNISLRPAFDKFQIQPKACECGKSSVSRIIGGTEAPKLKYPWITALCRSTNTNCGLQNQFCGGSLINNFYVVTAAHCVHGKMAGDIIVNIGDWDLNTTSEVNSTQLKVVQIITHKQYSSKTIENDIALLKLASPVNYSDEVKPICLPVELRNAPTYANVNATVIGWGQVDPNQPFFPTKLREVDVQVITNTLCSSQYGGSTIKSSMICASLPNKDSCYGDSGGPMAIKDSITLKWKLIGIVSFGNGCAKPNFAGVYTRVTSFLDWISKNMEGAEQCT